MEIEFSCTKYSDQEIMERKVKGELCPRERGKIVLVVDGGHAIPAITCSNCVFNRFSSYYTNMDTK